jgi:hypothetical protein
MGQRNLSWQIPGRAGVMGQGNLSGAPVAFHMQRVDMIPGRAGARGQGAVLAAPGWAGGVAEPGWPRAIYWKKGKVDLERSDGIAVSSSRPYQSHPKWAAVRCRAAT